MLASNRNIGQQILSRFRRSFHQIVISFPIHGEHKNVFFKIDLNISLLWLVKRGGRNSHDLYNKDFTTFYSRKIHKGKFIRFVYSYDEQWDGFRYIFKFTIFDLEEECRAFLKAYFNSYSKIISKCKTFARVSKSLCAEIAVYRSRNFVLLERRSLRIDWLTQIPHHFGCRFWGIINVKFWMINVKFYKNFVTSFFTNFYLSQGVFDRSRTPRDFQKRFHAFCNCNYFVLSYTLWVGIVSYFFV